jgi:hypothetical protein
VRRLGDEADAEGLISRGPRQAHLDGFDLHANVWVGANDRAGLERLCRYLLRPPFAQGRLRRQADGRVGLELKRAWHDGTRELVFAPLEFLERLAAMTPRPETNLLICHPETPRAPGDGSLRAEPRSRAARVRRHHALIDSWHSGCRRACAARRHPADPSGPAVTLRFLDNGGLRA